MRRAFTLLEVALVLAVILVLAAIAVPSIDSMYADVKLTAATDMIRARWADARARAIEEGRAYRFAVMPGQGNFRVAPDTADYWSGGSGGGDTTQGLVIEDELGEGITFADSTPASTGMNSAPPNSDMAVALQSQAQNAGTGGDSGGDWVRVVTFLPDGSTHDDVTIALNAPNARPVQLQLRALTGSVTTKALPAQER
jgi:prepilin-type N-terminal cleavage/methylation domain-containing protein